MTKHPYMTGQKVSIACGAYSIGIGVIAFVPDFRMAIVLGAGSMFFLSCFLYRQYTMLVERDILGYGHMNRNLRLIDSPHGKEPG